MKFFIYKKHHLYFLKILATSLACFMCFIKLSDLNAICVLLQLQHIHDQLWWRTY